MGGLLASLVLALGGCSGRDTVELDTAIPGAAPEAEIQAAQPADTVPPDTLAGRQLLWVLEAINERGDALQAHEIEEHFGARFISVMTTESIQDEFAAISRLAAPLEFLETSPDTSDISLLALIDGSNGQLTIGMNIEESTGKIAVIQFIQLLELAPPSGADVARAQRADATP